MDFLNSLPGEEWRPVVDHEGSYEVSNKGRVRSLDRLIDGGRGYPRRVSGRLMRSTTEYRGHQRIKLSGKRHLLHTLVLTAFVGPRPRGMEACHNDGNPRNNALENLRWDTRSANAQDKIRHGNNPYASRTHCGNGHEYTPENTKHVVIPRDGAPDYHRRICRTCAREYDRRKRAKHSPRKRASGELRQSA